MTLNQHGDLLVDILKKQIVVVGQEFWTGCHFNTICHRGYTAAIGFNIFFISWQDLVI